MKLFTLLLLYMCVLCGLRGPHVGVDTLNYLDIYLYGGWRYEPLFQLLIAVSKWIGLGVQGFLLLMAGMTFFPLLFFIREESLRPAVSVLIFLTFSVLFFHQTMNTIRASAAMSYCLLACHYWNRNRWKNVTICMLVAFGFHYSSIAVLILIAGSILFRKMGRMSYFLVIFSSLMIGVFFTFKIGALLGRALNAVAGLDLLSSGTGFYVGSNYLESLQESNLNTFGVFAALFPMSYFCVVLCDSINRDSLFYRLFVLAVVLSNIFLSVAIFYRITMLVIPLVIVIIPNTLVRSSRMRKGLLLAGMSMMVLWYFYQLLTAGPNDMAATVPYSFYWES